MNYCPSANLKGQRNPRGLLMLLKRAASKSKYFTSKRGKASVSIRTYNVVSKFQESRYSSTNKCNSKVVLNANASHKTLVKHVNDKIYILFSQKTIRLPACEKKNYCVIKSLKDRFKNLHRQITLSV